MSEKEKDTSKTQEELPEDEVENEGQDEGQEDNTKGEGIGEDVTSVYDDEDEAQDDSKDDSKSKKDKDDDGKKDDDKDKEDENDEEEKKDEGQDDDKSDEGQKGEEGKEGQDAGSKDGESDVDGSDAQKEAEGAEKGNSQPDAENDMSLQEPTENTGGNLGDTGSTDVPASSSNAAGSTAEGAGASGATGTEGASATGTSAGASTAGGAAAEGTAAAGTAAAEGTAAGGAAASGTAAGAGAAAGGTAAGGTAAAGSTAVAAGAAAGIGVFGIVLLVILIIFIIIGIFGFLTAIPSMTLEKIKEFVQGLWDGIQGYVIGTDEALVNDEELVDAAQYLYDMGYDLEGCGFVDNVEFETDENGNSTGVIKEVKSSYLTAYLVAENRTYLISNDNFNLKDVFGSIVSGRITDGLSSSWGSGMIHIDDGIWSEAAMVVRGIPVLGWGIDQVASLVEDVSVDRETNTLKIARTNFSSGLAFWNWRKDYTYYNLAGWTGRYGKPFELLITLHLSTMAPDFAYEIAMNEDLDTKVNIGLKNATFSGTVKVQKSDGTVYTMDQLDEAGYSQDTIDQIKDLANNAGTIETKTPYIKTVEHHWFRNVYFDTDGKTVEYAEVDEKSEEEQVEEEANMSEEEKAALEYEDEPEDTQYKYTEGDDGKKQLVTTSGAIDVYETSDSTETFEYTGDEIEGLNSGDKIIYEGSIADRITQKEDGVRGVTNPTTKELFKGEYYIYDGTIEKANNIKDGKEEKQQIQFNDNSLSAFSILEHETSIDSQLIYRDLKELLVELDYFDYSDFEEIENEILEWPIPDYKYYSWPYTYLEKQVLDYGTLILSKDTVDKVKEKYGLDKLTIYTNLSSMDPVKEVEGLEQLDNISSKIKTQAKGNEKVTGKFSEETQAIVEEHINDFNVDNFYSKIEEYGGYESYLINHLGGVFAKYPGADHIANVTTVEEFQEVAEYVFGLMTIYGFDYCNGEPEDYGIWRANDGGTSDGFYKGRTSGRPGTLAPRNIDTICSGNTAGGTNMTVNCNWGMDYLYYKAGLFSTSDESKPTSCCNVGDLVNNHGGQIITNVSDLQVGDLIQCYEREVTDHSNPETVRDEYGWFHVCCVGEIDEEAGTMTLYDAGHFFTNSGNYKNVVKLDGSDWPYKGWEGIHVFDLEENDVITGFEEGLDVIAMGDGTVSQVVESEKYGTGVKIDLTGDTKIKGYELMILGFDVSITEGSKVKATDVIGTTTKENMCIILIDREKANVENVEDYVRIPKKKKSLGDITLGDDYDVSDESYFIQDIEQFKMMFAGYTNIVDNAQAFLDMQEKYGVNAVFAAAVTIAESSGGTNWAAIDPSTHNWFSIRGSYNGNSVNGWRSYPSFATAVDDFGNLIANSSYYYGAGKKKVSEIGPTYCDEAWSKTVADLMTDAYKKVIN